MSLGRYLSGAHVLNDTLTAVDIWLMIHADAKEWDEVPRNSHFFTIREMLDTADLDALRKLCEMDAINWEHLCFGAGWTIYGCVGLSWCQGAEIERVSELWQQNCEVFEPDEGMLRAASLICPAILPETLSLSKLIEAAHADSFLLSLIVAAKIRDIEVDIPESAFANTPSALLPVFTEMLSSNSRSSEYQELLKRWGTSCEPA